MAYDASGTSKEVKSLLSRYPKPDAARAAALRDKADADMLERMGTEYDKRMPSPEPGEAKPKRLAKGGVTRADGCCQRGKTRGRFV